MATQLEVGEFTVTWEGSLPVTWTTITPFNTVQFAPVPEMDTEQKIRLLDEMIEIVEGKREDKKWTKGAAAVAIGPATIAMCLGGMVHKLSGGSLLNSTVAETRNAVMRAIGEVIVEQFADRVSIPPGTDLGSIPEPGAAVVPFNDHQRTTKEDVVLVLEKARMKIAEAV